MATLRYDDANLRQLFAEMDTKKRLRALKGAFRRVANEVRKTALANLRGTGINHADELGRGVRAVVFKRVSGFRVTVGSKKANKQGKGERGMHVNRRGLKKPILVWAEAGTKYRHVKGRVRVRGVNGKWYTAPTRRGLMPRYAFMEKTAKQTDGRATEMLHQEVITSVEKIAKKYGCK